MHKLGLLILEAETIYHKWTGITNVVQWCGVRLRFNRDRNAQCKNLSHICVPQETIGEK